MATRHFDIALTMALRFRRRPSTIRGPSFFRMCRNSPELEPQTTQMHYELTIIPKIGYIHAVITGQNGPTAVVGYLNELLSEIRIRGCPFVLVEERLEGPRMSMAEVFEVVSRGSEAALGSIKSLAYVDVNSADDTMKFAELVATNRTIPVRVFATVREAERWLQDEVKRLGGEK
jgi:hypothetical protein